MPLIVTHHLPKCNGHRPCGMRNITHLSRNIGRPCHQGILWLYGWKLFIVGNHHAKFDGPGHCASGDITFNLWHDLERPRDRGVLWLYERKLLIVCNHSAKFNGHGHLCSGDIISSVGQATLKDHVIKGLCDFTEKTFPLYAKTVPGLVAIDTVVGDTFLIIPWPHVSMCSKGCRSSRLK